MIHVLIPLKVICGELGNAPPLIEELPIGPFTFIEPFVKLMRLLVLLLDRAI